MRNRKSDIEKYLRGELTATEMHALEMEALRDPFLAEALEGIDRTGHESFLFDLKELNKSVHQRTSGKKRTRIIAFSNWQLGVAAAVLLIAASSAYLISLVHSQQQGSRLALSEMAAQKPEEQKAPSDTVSEAPTTNEQLALNRQEAKPSAAGPKSTAPTQQPLVTPPVASHVDEGADAAESAQTDNVVSDALKESLGGIAVTLTKDSIVAVDPIAKKSADLAAGATSDDRAKRVQSLKTFKSVFGKVTSAEDGSALPGVNVVVKGTRKGTVTDDEGRYEIALDDPKQQLVFSFIGLQPVEAQTVEGQKVDVQMAQDFSQLSEIVVTGSGVEGKTKTPVDDHPALQFAEPMGGRKAFQQYLENQLHYPTEAMKNKIEGRVTVQFTVNPDGELGDFTVIKGLGYGCDDEVIRLIKEGPAWAPTKRDDQPVKDKVKIRLKFDLPD